MGSTSSQDLRQGSLGLNTAAGVNIEAGLPGNGFQHSQINRMAGAGTVEVDQVKAAQARIRKTPGNGNGVGIIGGLPGKIAGAQPHTLAIDKVDSRNNFH